MDGRKAAPPTGSDRATEGAALPSPRVPDGAAAAALNAPTVAGAVLPNGSGAGAEEEVDDEQVERFYALLANIRAMRRAYTPGAGNAADGGEAAPDGGGARKRLRSADPPWRPAFRLEDFEDAVATTATSRTERKRLADDYGDKATVTASPSVSRPQSPRAGARRVDSNSKTD